MWEITLIDELYSFKIFEEFSKYIKNIFKENVLIDFKVKDNNLFFHISFNDKKNLKRLKTIIYEIIIKTYKNYYFISNFYIKNINKNLMDFIVFCIININLKDEIIYAKKTTNLTNVVYIKSFMEFKLSDIILSWNDLIFYIKNNFNNSCFSATYIDFLRFLSFNLESKFDLILLNQSEENIDFLDKNNDIIFTMPLKDEIGILVNLILFSPKKLIINSFNKFSKKILNLISYIFEDKISYIM